MSEKAPTITSPEYGDLHERFRDTDGERENKYTILRGDKQEVRGRVRVWDTDYVHEKYLAATDRLIGILDGSITQHEITDPRDPEKAAEVPDTVVYLDKSARPVSWFVKEFWGDMSNGTTEKPETKFLNIDRTAWFTRQGHLEREAESTLGPKDFDIDKVSDSDIARIRAIFLDLQIDEATGKRKQLDMDNWEEDVWNHPTVLDGKNILVVDEVKNKGGTLSIAAQLLRRAIPESTAVNGDYYWKAGRYALGGDASNLQMESAPAWYSKESPWGRGVGDLSKAYYESRPKSPGSERRALGYIALSAPHINPVTMEAITDKDALALREDIAHLADDYRAGRVFAMPSIDREQKDLIRILENRYPGIPVREIGQYRIKRDEENKYAA